MARLGAPVLVASTEAELRRTLETAVRSWGYEPVLAGSVQEVIGAPRRQPFALGLVDLALDGAKGLDVLRGISQSGAVSGPVIVITGDADDGRLGEATALGADDFVPRLFQVSDLEAVVREALSRPRRNGDGATDPTSPASRLTRELSLWQSAKMREVYQVIQQSARIDVTVLIGGETGTGKELVAHAIHHLSTRRPAPFVKVNCAAVPRELLESELFGHERGAFTGAHQMKVGQFEAADKGSIFLDEIGDIHPALQAKLLHVLQDGEFSRVGGRSTLRVDVRVMAATNRELERDVEAMRFREDLYYRLNVVQITVPPLRERMEEVPLLARYFAQRYAKLFHREGFALAPQAIDRLMQHHYPGNVRELENLVKRMIVMDDPTFQRTKFSAPSNGKHAETSSGLPARPPATPSLREVARAAARAAEREAIVRVLTQTGWNRARAARLLKVSYRSLLYKIKDAGLEQPADVVG